MMWTGTLTTEHQGLLRALEDQHCRFVWRDRIRQVEDSEPFEQDQCWFEIWRERRLLGFAGPLDCPVSEESIQAVGNLLFQQAGLLIRRQTRRA